MGLKFSYSMVNSDDTRRVYRQMLDDDAQRVYEWRDRSPSREFLTSTKLVNAWWMSRGPTAFDTAQDATQYKRELTMLVDWQRENGDAVVRTATPEESPDA